VGDAGDAPRALPQLAVHSVHHFLRRRDRGLVVVGFEPFAGRDLVDRIETVKPVSCHPYKPEFCCRGSDISAAETSLFAFGFRPAGS
jgi:hypothetical protein